MGIPRGKYYDFLRYLYQSTHSEINWLFYDFFYLFRGWDEISPRHHEKFKPRQQTNPLDIGKGSKSYPEQNGVKNCMGGHGGHEASELLVGFMNGKTPSRLAGLDATPSPSMSFLDVMNFWHFFSYFFALVNVCVHSTTPMGKWSFFGWDPSCQTCDVMVFIGRREGSQCHPRP